MGKFNLIRALAWRNLWRNPHRSLLVIIAVASGLWSILSFTALLQSWNVSTLSVALKDMTGQGQIHASGYLDNPGVSYRMPSPTGKLKQLLQSQQVKQWATRVRVPATIQSAYQTMPVVLYGIDPIQERNLSFIAEATYEGQRLVNANTSGIMLGKELAKRLKIKTGQRIVIMSQNTDGSLSERGLRVTGLFSAAPRAEKQYVFMSLHQAQSLLGTGKDISEIAFNLKRQDQLEAFLQRLHKTAPDLDVKSWQVLRPMTQAMTELSDGFVKVWIFIMFVLMAFGIVNTLMMSLHERVRELALFQALGLRPELVFTQVILESSLLVLTGVVVGLLLSVATLMVLHQGLDLGFLARGAQWLGIGRVLYPQLNFQQIIAIGALIWGLGVFASLLPSWRMIRRVPIEVINRSST